MEDSTKFYQEEPDSILPPGYRLTVTYSTVDLDPGDPETGPRPDIQTVPIEWELRAIGGLLICEGKTERGGVWIDRNGEPSEDLLRVIYDIDERRDIARYLYDMLGL